MSKVSEAAGAADNSRPPPNLEHLKTLGEYQGARTHIWPTLASVRWFIRTNKPDLLECGALLILGGRLVIDEPRFDAAVERIGRAQAGIPHGARILGAL